MSVAEEDTDTSQLSDVSLEESSELSDDDARSGPVTPRSARHVAVKSLYKFLYGLSDMTDDVDGRLSDTSVVDFQQIFNALVYKQSHASAVLAAATPPSQHALPDDATGNNAFEMEEDVELMHDTVFNGPRGFYDEDWDDTDNGPLPLRPGDAAHALRLGADLPSVVESNVSTGATTGSNNTRPTVSFMTRTTSTDSVIMLPSVLEKSNAHSAQAPASSSASADASAGGKASVGVVSGGPSVSAQAPTTADPVAIDTRTAAPASAGPAPAVTVPVSNSADGSRATPPALEPMVASEPKTGAPAVNSSASLRAAPPPAPTLTPAPAPAPNPSSTPAPAPTSAPAVTTAPVATPAPAEEKSRSPPGPVENTRLETKSVEGSAAKTPETSPSPVISAASAGVVESKTAPVESAGKPVPTAGAPEPLAAVGTSTVNAQASVSGAPTTSLPPSAAPIVAAPLASATPAAAGAAASAASTPAASTGTPSVPPPSAVTTPGTATSASTTPPTAPLSDSAASMSDGSPPQQAAGTPAVKSAEPAPFDGGFSFMPSSGPALTLGDDEGDDWDDEGMGVAPINMGRQPSLTMMADDDEPPVVAPTIAKPVSAQAPKEGSSAPVASQPAKEPVPAEGEPTGAPGQEGERRRRRKPKEGANKPGEEDAATVKPADDATKPGDKAPNDKTPAAGVGDNGKPDEIVAEKPADKPAAAAANPSAKKGCHCVIA